MECQDEFYFCKPSGFGFQFVAINYCQSSEIESNPNESGNRNEVGVNWGERCQATTCYTSRYLGSRSFWKEDEYFSRHRIPSHSTKVCSLSISAPKTKADTNPHAVSEAISRVKAQNAVNLVSRTQHWILTVSMTQEIYRQPCRKITQRKLLGPFWACEILRLWNVVEKGRQKCDINNCAMKLWSS